MAHRHPDTNGIAILQRVALQQVAIRDGIVPANINIENRDPELPPVLIPAQIVEKKIRVALSNSFGFGGHNSSLLLGSV